MLQCYALMLHCYALMLRCYALMLCCYALMLRCYSYSLSIHTCSQQRYFTLLHYQSVPTFKLKGFCLINALFTRYAGVATYKNQKILKIPCTQKMERWCINQFEILCRTIFYLVFAGISRNLIAEPQKSKHLTYLHPPLLHPQYSQRREYICPYLTYPFSAARLSLNLRSFRQSKTLENFNLYQILFWPLLFLIKLSLHSRVSPEISYNRASKSWRYKF